MCHRKRCRWGSSFKAFFRSWYRSKKVRKSPVWGSYWSVDVLLSINTLQETARRLFFSTSSGNNSFTSLTCFLIWVSVLSAEYFFFVSLSQPLSLFISVINSSNLLFTLLNSCTSLNLPDELTLLKYNPSFSWV